MAHLEDKVLKICSFFVIIKKGVSASTSVFRPQIVTFSKNDLKTSTTSTIPTQEYENDQRV